MSFSTQLRKKSLWLRTLLGYATDHVSNCDQVEQPNPTKSNVLPTSSLTSTDETVRD